MARFKVTFILLYLITILPLLFTSSYATELVNNKDSIEDGKDIVKTDDHLDVEKEEKIDVSFDKVETTDSAVSLEHENHGSSGEHFIAVPAHNLGAVENLDPSLKGLTGIVTSKLPASVRLVRIVDATREVVAGIRYDFTLEVVNTLENSEPYLCAFALLERPWIKTEWGSKDRSVILNNCTNEDKIVEEKPIVEVNNKPSFAEKESKISDNTENNELTAPLNNIVKVEPSTESTKVEVNYDTVAEFGHIEEIADAMSPERLKHMEDQIIAKAEPHYVETVTQGEDLRIEEESASPTKSPYYIETVTDIIKEEDKIVVVKIEEQDERSTEAYNIETVTLILKEEPKVEVMKLESSANEETNPKVEPCNVETVTAIIETYEPIKIEVEKKPDEEKILLKKDALEGLDNWLNNVRILEKSPTHDTIDDIKYKSLETDPHKPVAGETLDALKEYLDDVRIKNKETQTTEKSEEPTQTEATVTQIVDTEKLSAFEGLLGLLEEPKATKIEQTHIETEQEQRVPVEEIFVAEKAFSLGTKTDSDSSSESSEESNENKISSGESSEEDIVTSYVTRRKRSTSKNLIMKLANNAINALDHIDSDNRKRVVLDILDSKQKIKSDGTYYTIKVRIATTDCSETVENINKCSKMLIKDTIKICNIEIKKNGDEERVIKSQCTPVRKLNRSKRHRLVGGVSPADPNDPYVQEVLTDVTGKLQSYHQLQHPLNVKVNSVSKQVVAGMLYKYEIEIDNNEFEKQTCSISVWDRSWIPDGREITAECGSPNSNSPRSKIEFKKKSVEKRSIHNLEESNKSIPVRRHLKGGVSPADPNDPYIQEVLTDITGKLQSYHQLQHPLNVKVNSVSKQVVAGMLYKYEIEIDNNEFDKQTCSVSVWDRPWLADGREITVQCGSPDSSAPRTKIEFKKKSVEKRSINNLGESHKSVRVRRHTLGGTSPADLNDPYIQEVLTDVTGKLQSYHQLQNPLNVKVNSVSKQVVAGMLYKYEIEIDNNEFEKQTCSISVWDRSWIPDGREITAECGSSNSNSPRSKIEFKKKSVQKRSINNFEEADKLIRVRRQKVGAAKPVDPNDPYAQEILNNIKGNLQSYHQLEHPLNIKVISVTKTTVAGSLYKYEIEIDNNEFDKQACLVSVWDRPWIPNGREINAECGAPNTTVKDKKIKLTNRRKRETLVGGVSPADPNDSSVQEVLLDIKGKLQSYHGLQNELNVKLLSVTQQVVAGALYKYEIEIDNDDFDKQKCLVSVWDRPWIEDGREITAECGEPNSNVRNKIEFKKSQKKRSMYDFETDHFDLLSTMDDEELMKLSSFDSFIRDYNKTYSRNEFLFRFNVFKQNLERINKLNRNEMGTAIYGINEFSDLTRREFKIHTGLLPREEETNEIPRALAELFENDPLPESFDWRERGVVSPVKNQGSCGSCWAFSVTGNIEGLNAIKTGKLVEFSEQELLDCDSIDAACNGGLPDNAYKAIEQIGGLESETDYPYEGRKEKTCHFNSTLSKVKVKGAVDLPKNETKIAQFLVLNGPISIGINANAMQFYRGGVSHPWKALCSPAKLDHGVLIVGYGTHSYPKFKKDLPYWIIKNSWGPSWGEQGYYRVYRGDGTCGVDQMASSAIIE